jgi:predicted methyltransferase
MSTPARRAASHLALLAGLPLLVAGCANAPADHGDPDEAVFEALAAAVAAPQRPAADRTDDTNRKPAQVLAALGIQPGMRVLDLLAAGGYYSEILSRAVGDQGSVLLHNNQAYRDFIGVDLISQRTAGGRLPNVENLDSELADLGLRPGELDAALLILGFHDLYLLVDDGSWPVIDPPALLQALFVALKPGGIFGIVDHAAVAGSDPYESAKGPHRIDQAFLQQVVTDAGFVFEFESDVLRNPADDRLTTAFDESIRRRTDRFVLRFRKPR